MKRSVWMNNTNQHKFIEVVRYKCGHFYVCQYMEFIGFDYETGGAKLIRNYTGAIRNRRCRRRWTKKNLDELLMYYEEVTA